MISRGESPWHRPPTSTTAWHRSDHADWTGPIIALFVLFHLADLTWGWWLGDDFVSGDPYHNVAESMGYLSMAIIYVVANIALAWHVFHGAWSMFQSLGVVAVHQRNEIGFPSGLRAARFG